jgi:ankyrin repeat protein
MTPLSLLVMQDGKTVLWVASENGHAEVVRQLLLAPGMDVNAAMKVSNQAPLQGASQFLCNEICSGTERPRLLQVGSRRYLQYSTASR